MQYSVIVLAIAIIMVPIAFKIMKKSKFLDRLTVKETLTTEKGYTARKNELNQYIGAVGKAQTVLRPSGTMTLADGTRLDVVTQGEFIDQGEEIVVKAIDGTWLIVHKVIH